ETLYGLSDFYCQGYAIDWSLLIGGTTPKRLHIPTYSFAREKYWITETKSDLPALTQGASVSAIHPLIQKNTSDFKEQRFTSTFTGKEFFLNDHQVKGEKVLPGVAYLEMARAAVEKASGELEEGTTIHLKNVVWAQPIFVNEAARKVHIGLFGEESGQIQYEVYTETDNEEEPVVHSQGVAEFKEKGEIPVLDIQNLKSQMNQGTLNTESCYQAFKEMGIEYGEGHQGIREIYQGENQILARLSLPSSVNDTQSEYVLHPSLLDSALQSSIGLMLKNGALANGSEAPPGIGRWPQRPLLPFALESLEIVTPCTFEMYAWVRYSGRSAQSDKVQKLDIELCDNEGNVCVKMRAFSSRILEGEVGIPQVKDSIGTLLAIPAWKETAKLSSLTRQTYAAHQVLLCEITEIKARELQSLIPGSNCRDFESNQDQIETRFTECATCCFEIIRNFLERKPQGKVLFQILVPNTREQSLFVGLSGLLKTASLENPKIVGQLIQVEPGGNGEAQAEKLEESKNTPYEAIIKYESGKRFVWNLEELKETEVKPGFAFKDKGVYLITGGVGGLGVLFTREILRETKDAKIILAGRSELSNQRQFILDELQALGGSVEYKIVDVSSFEQVNSLIESIKAKHGKLDGIIHSAGVILDNFILKKSEEEFRKVLQPKVTGTIILDKATQDIELDFFVLFSSGAGVTGNIGQADYATANAFMDRFADYRNKLVESKERKGHTLSINWPLWKDGGMGIDVASEAMMKQTTGMVAMQTGTGIRALYQSLNSTRSQVIVMEGLVSKMRKTLISQPFHQTKGPVDQAVIGNSIDTGSLLTRIQRTLIQTVSKTLKLDIHDIDLDGEFSEYGFDSISLTDFANQLNEKYKLELTPTLFFEYSTIGTFSDYLLREHESVFVEQFHVEANTHTHTSSGGVKDQEKSATILKGRRSRFVTPKPVESVSQEVEPIAIVGMSGCFPEAENIDQFWQNLVEEKDCISEIPKERWDWKALYGDPHKEVNKCNIKWGGFIDNVFEFDPLFFGISPREAELMDPQQRLLMTYVYQAIEDAGYSVSGLSGSNTGIFVGTGSSGYSGMIERVGIAIEGYTSTGMVPSVGPNRMSYFLDFHGPSEPIETACSSSLVAIHRALQAVETGGCDAAIVGGINTIITPEAHISFNKAGMLCEDGRCKSFSSAANGYVRGEGAGMLFVKKLSKAEADGDHIYGLIRGSAENHGGKANSLTAPNPNAQAALLKAAYKKSGLDPGTISYIEAHGTGTELGDPIEINGLKTAFRDLYREFSYDTATVPHCGIGSVKSNIGHLELAAGVAGVIKVLLQFKHQKLVSTLHCKEINPYIDLKDTPFYILQGSRDWDRLKDESGLEIPRRAGVSSFGFGGSNAHVVLEEYIAKSSEVHSVISAETKEPVMIVLSARTEDHLEVRASDLLEFLRYPKPMLPNTHNDESNKRLEIRLQLEAKIDEMLSNLLNVDKETMDPGQSFSDYGVERIHLTNVFETISEEYDFELDLDEWITHDSLETLLNYCLGNENESLVESTAEIPDVDLQSLAYTLQAGREAMEERLGFIVTSIKELEEKLEAYLSGDQDIEDTYRGQVKRNKDTLSVFKADEDLQQAIETWIDKGKYSKILDLWVKGLVLDWTKLYGDSKPKRMSLPTYPFAKERYCISETPGKGMIPTSGTAASLIHPLLHENSSDFREQRFTSMFTGKEFFLNDHQVKGEKVLPGVCYLEMAITAVEKASGETEEGVSISLKNVVWAQPIVVGGSTRKVHIGLLGEDNGEIQYEVYTESDREEAIVHFQGVAVFMVKKDTLALDLQNIKLQMNQGILSTENCYQAFKKMGIEYGEGHQGILEIYQGEDQALARLSLPSSVQDTQSEYVLHPSLMDAALQSSIGLVCNNGVLTDGSGTPCLHSMPFALKSLETLAPCTSVMYAWVRYSAGSSPSDEVQRLDIDLCDKHGNVCVKMRGLTFRALEVEITESETGDSTGTLLATPVWKETPALSIATRQPYSER
ncbi:MAG: SDR family NAD(P)-dependent oxidoreductase, partial [Planctomycetes bacterium]|nr:SDR family NAD(P)-dependent oxidoreductase [Planctomycetota bacterium]